MTRGKHLDYWSSPAGSGNNVRGQSSSPSRVGRAAPIAACRVARNGGRQRRAWGVAAGRLPTSWPGDRADGRGQAGRRHAGSDDDAGARGWWQRAYQRQGWRLGGPDRALCVGWRADQERLRAGGQRCQRRRRSHGQGARPKAANRDQHPGRCVRCEPDRPAYGDAQQLRHPGVFRRFWERPARGGCRCGREEQDALRGGGVCALFNSSARLQVPVLTISEVAPAYEGDLRPDGHAQSEASPGGHLRREDGLGRGDGEWVEAAGSVARRFRSGRRRTVRAGFDGFLVDAAESKECQSRRGADGADAT